MTVIFFIYYKINELYSGTLRAIKEVYKIYYYCLIGI